MGCRVLVLDVCGGFGSVLWVWHHSLLSAPNRDLRSSNAKLSLRRLC